MKSIWKYSLELTDRQELEMPEGAWILSVQMQCNNICLWVAVNTEVQKKKRVIYIVGTGHNVGHLHRSLHRFIGTVQMRGGALVWHIFEEEV